MVRTIGCGTATPPVPAESSTGLGARFAPMVIVRAVDILVYDTDGDGALAEGGVLVGAGGAELPR